MNREQRRAAGRRQSHQPAASALDAMTGHRIPGGCDDCTAYQTVEQHAPGLYVLAVHHDLTCPEYRRRTR